MACGRHRYVGSRCSAGLLVKRPQNLSNSQKNWRILRRAEPQLTYFIVRVSCTCPTSVSSRICEKTNLLSASQSVCVGYTSRGSWARAGHQDGGRGRTPRPIEKPPRHEKTHCRRRVRPGRVCDERRTGLCWLVLSQVLRQVGRVRHAI